MNAAADVSFAEAARWLELEEDASRRARRTRPEPSVSPLKLSAAQRLGAARGLPPAIVKVVRGGATNGGRSLRTQLAYLSRDDTLAFTTDYGMVCDGPGDLDRALASWRVDFDATDWARKTTHLVISTPRGADGSTLEAAAQRFCAAVFGADGAPGAFGEEWGFLRVAHADTDHAHMHIVVNNRGRRQGRQFEVHPAKAINPQSLRSAWTAAAAAEGLALDDTPRRARGLPKSHDRTPDWRRRHRGETSSFEDSRAAETLRRLRAGTPSPEAERMATARATAFVDAERAEYRRMAAIFEGFTKRARTAPEKARLAEEAAALLRGFADRLGAPWTHTRAAAEQILASRRAARTQKGPAADPIADRARLAELAPAVLAQADRDVARLLSRAGLDGAAAIRGFQTPQEHSAERARQIGHLERSKNLDPHAAARRIDAAHRAAGRIYAHLAKAAQTRTDAQDRNRRTDNTPRRYLKRRR